MQPARVENLRDVLAAPGVVVPSSLADQNVTSSETAEIAELPRSQGEAVQAGDLLVRFDIASITSDLLARQLELSEASAKATAARAEVTRLQSLFERGVIARNTLESSKSAQSVVDAALTEATIRLDASKLLQERTIVRARFAGVIHKVWHKLGDVVSGSATDPVLRVIDPKRVQVAVQVSLTELERVAAGQMATVQSATAPAEAATVAAKASPSDSAATRAEVRLSFAGQTTLAIDTPVQVEILLGERREAVVVPSSAVLRDQASSFVWVAGDDSLAHRRDIRAGLVAGGLTQVLFGLTAGERVIVAGLAELVDGTPITVTR